MTVSANATATATAVSPEALQQLMIDWQRMANSDKQLLRLGRLASLSLCIRINDTPFYLVIDNGRLERIDTGPFHLRHADLELSASWDNWQRFFQPVPPPGFHDILAMSSYFHLRVTGNQHLLREHLAYLKHLLALPRQRNQPA